MGVKTYEYMDDCEQFDETSLPEKEEFCCHWNMKDITKGDYAHAKIVCQDFETKNLGECRNLYVQSDTLLLDDAFEKFWNTRHEICELDSDHLIFAPGWA